MKKVMALTQLIDTTLQGSRDPQKYRPNAGLAVFSQKGHVFAGRRTGSTGPFQWQLPQGGIDAGEDILAAAYRELEEETGISKDKVDFLEEIEPWLYYDFPEEVLQRFKGKYLGQRQKWFAFRFKGLESDIKLDLHEPEFDAWKWIPLQDVPELIIPFKRDIYESISQKFQQWTNLTD